MAAARPGRPTVDDISECRRAQALVREIGAELRRHAAAHGCDVICEQV